MNTRLDFGDTVTVKNTPAWKRLFVSSQRRKHAGRTGTVFYTEMGEASRKTLVTIHFTDDDFGFLFEDELEET